MGFLGSRREGEGGVAEAASEEKVEEEVEEGVREREGERAKRW